MRRMTQQAQARAGSRKVLCLTLSMGGGTLVLKVDDALAAVDDFVSEKLNG